MSLLLSEEEIKTFGKEIQQFELMLKQQIFDPVKSDWNSLGLPTNWKGFPFSLNLLLKIDGIPAIFKFDEGRLEECRLARKTDKYTMVISGEYEELRKVAKKEVNLVLQALDGNINIKGKLCLFAWFLEQTEALIMVLVSAIEACSFTKDSQLP